MELTLSWKPDKNRFCSGQLESDVAQVSGHSYSECTTYGKTATAGSLESLVLGHEMGYEKKIKENMRKSKSQV